MDSLRALSDLVERVSRRYAGRHGIERDEDWFLLKLQEEVGELTQAYVRFTGRSRAGRERADEDRAAMEGELADVLCHALLFARRHGLDLDGAVQRKWLAYLDD